MAYLPVESVIRNRQDEYYMVLGNAYLQAESAGFVEVLLRSILEALNELSESDQV